ncbi:MAG: heparinase II/III family protein [Pseudomonadota bacterium]
MSTVPLPPQTSPRRAEDADAELWARFQGKSGEDVKATAGHRLKIAGAKPEGLGLFIKPILPANEMRGEQLMKGVWRIGMDRMVLADGLAPWRAQMPCRHYADRIHRFDWLPDIFTQGDMGADRARYLVDDWIENFGRFDGFSWRPSCAADRAWNWMCCGSALFDEGDDKAIEARLETLARQVRHVAALVDADRDPIGVFRSATLSTAWAACVGKSKQLEEAIERLEVVCTAQFLLDGGHVSRSPARTLRCLADLLVIQDVLERADRPIPEFLMKWIGRAGAMVAFFRVGDHALVPFQDGDERLDIEVEAVLERLDGPPRQFSVVPKSGYQKLSKACTVVYLDCGAGPERPYGDKAHAGALSFELVDGTARLVTSCANSPETDLDWRAAVRRTSAHSTLILDNQDSAPFLRNEESALLYPDGPEAISAKRLEEADETWLDAQHSGYKAKFGLLHRRRLFMAGDGCKLTGEDSLSRPVSAGISEDETPIPFDIRFHLHPTVSAMTAGDSIVLTSETGAVWRFKTTHSGARLEPTIYLGRGVVEHSEQIVLSGKADPNGDGTMPPNCVRWVFLKDKRI